MEKIKIPASVLILPVLLLYLSAGVLHPLLHEGAGCEHTSVQEHSKERKSFEKGSLSSHYAHTDKVCTLCAGMLQSDMPETEASGFFFTHSVETLSGVTDFYAYPEYRTPPVRAPPTLS